MGPIERWQHTGRLLVRPTPDAGAIAKAAEEHVVDIMVTKGLLTETQSEAAMRLKADFQMAGLAIRTIGRYAPRLDDQPNHNRGRPDRSDAAEAAYRRWRHAVEEIGGRAGTTVVDAACFDKMPSLSGIALLQEGLEKLVDWYGLEGAEKQKS
ncbi:MAG: hypothetical protein JO126_07940 [Alphaproteobacteria bacterium]|nr:hypothetical protein [Alphaproteobacteria bacterium]